MKNVLIISYIYPPYNAPAARRPYSWAKYLDKTKYKVTVLTCSNPDSSLGIDATMNNELPHVDIISVESALKSKIGAQLRDVKMAKGSPGIVSKIKTYFLKIASYFLIPDKAIFWFFNAKKHLVKNKELVSAFDIVISTSPTMTNHLLGVFLKKKNPNIQLIGDLRDYHYIGHHKTHSPWPLSLFHKRYEHSIITKADIVTFISNAMKKEYASHYHKMASKFSVIYNGFDKDDFNLEPRFQETKSDKLTIFYAGSFYGGVRSPKGLLQLLDWAIENKSITLDDIEIIIAGNFENELQDEMKSFNSFKAINYIGKIPRSDVINYYHKSSILWLIVGEKLSHYTGVPLKFYEYLAAQKYILNFAPNKSEVSFLIDENNLGSNIDIYNDSKEEQLQVLENILYAWKDNGLNILSQDKVMASYDRKNQAKILEKIIDRHN